MITSENLVATAREYVGTPFHFGGRLKGVGIDCGGLLACVVQELGLAVEIPRTYDRTQTLAPILRALEGRCDRITNGSLREGDILVFASRSLPGHCGLYTGEDSFIHAYDSPSVSEVVETPLSDVWRDRIAFVYRLRELG